MKIKNIEISNYGIFSKDVKFDTKNFSTNNIIFGWNYSGKTTFSRIFRSLEKKEAYSDFADGRFKIFLEDDSTIDEDNVKNHSLNVRVFNTDYIRDNLEWEETDVGIPPILIIGETSIKLEKRLNELRKTKIRVEEKKEEHKRVKERTSKHLQSLTTKEARHITNELALGRSFTRSNLEKLLDNNDIEEWYLPNKEFQRLRTIAQSSRKLDPIQEIDMEIDETILDTTKMLLSKTVTPTKTIERLKNNVDLEGWVRKGRTLHKEKEICEFCGNNLSPDLLPDLDAHFSRDYEDSREEVEKHLGLITREKLAPDLKMKNDFYPELHEDYLAIRKDLENGVNRYNASMMGLGKQVGEKLSRLTDKIMLDDNIVLNVERIVEHIKEKTKALNELIKKNGQKTKDFDSRKQNAVETLKLHYASQFFKDNEISGKKNELKKLDRDIERLSNENDTTVEEIENIEQQISESVKGSELLNQFIKCYFGSGSQIVIRPENDRFYLYRGKEKAKNFSEGEKTAIAFSYFLTQLNSKDTKDILSQAIVFVDDPISSLDNNHIFNTYALIVNTLKGKCGQLFISTHNYEFFNLLKDEFVRRNIRGCDFEKRKNHTCKAPFYQIERNATNAWLKNLDCLLCRFKSEYQYVFYQLYHFYQEGLGDEYKLYTTPNLLRRFLEIYLGFNYPSERGLGERLGNLIIDENDRVFVHKIINEFSHSENIERSFKMYTTDEIKKAIEIVFNALEQSSAMGKHFEELKETVGIKSQATRLSGNDVQAGTVIDLNS